MILPSRSLSYDKDNANEREVSLLTISRVQLILCKDTTFPLKCNYHDFFYRTAMRNFHRFIHPARTTYRHHISPPKPDEEQYYINIILLLYNNNLTFSFPQSGKETAGKRISYNRKGTVILPSAEYAVAGKPVPHRQTVYLILRMRLFRIAKDTIRHDRKGSFAKQRIRCREPPEA